MSTGTVEENNIKDGNKITLLPAVESGFSVSNYDWPWHNNDFNLERVAKILLLSFDIFGFIKKERVKRALNLVESQCQASNLNTSQKHIPMFRIPGARV